MADVVRVVKGGDVKFTAIIQRQGLVRNLRDRQVLVNLESQVLDYELLLQFVKFNVANIRGRIGGNVVKILDGSTEDLDLDLVVNGGYHDA